MSNKIKVSPVKKLEPTPPKHVFFDKYISIISLSIGSIIGLLFWYFLIRCGNGSCAKLNYPVPFMGISAFITWCIFIAIFKKG